MKTILFISRSLNTGGIERALINQLLSLDKREYDITLMLFSKGGTLLSELPKHIHIIHGGFLLDCVSKSFEQSTQNALIFLVRNLILALVKIFGSRNIYRCLFTRVKIRQSFNYAIAYQSDIDSRSLYYGCNLFALDRVSANTKITWLHSDYTFMKKTVHTDDSLFNRFDKIVNVSNIMKQKFDSLHLVPKEKSFVVYNRIPMTEIIKMSVIKDNFIEDKNLNKFIIVSVCRMDKLKSVYELCILSKKLHNYGLDFRWIFCGNGPELSRCKEYIKEQKLEDCVQFIGETKNPYQYIKRADLFVSGSILETFGLSLAEALVLKTPVVAMKFEAVEEVLQHKVNGVVVNNFEEMYSAIIKCATDELFYNSLKDSTKLLKNYNALNDLQFKLLLE